MFDQLILKDKVRELLETHSTFQFDLFPFSVFLLSCQLSSRLHPTH